MFRSLLRLLVLLIAFAAGSVHAALPPEVLSGLGSKSFGERIDAIEALAIAGPAGAQVLDAIEAGDFGALDERPVIVRGDTVIDMASGEPLEAAASDVSKLRVNNRVRRAISTARAGVELETGSEAQRLAAAQTLVDNASERLLPLFDRVIENETLASVRELVVLARARVLLGSDDPADRRAAAEALGESSDRAVLTLLAPLVERQPGEAGAPGPWNDPDASVRAAAADSITAIERRVAFAANVAIVFSGVSLGSILLLAALGLAITFGVMGVINMAHGELLMVGAYATYLVQNVFRTQFPEYFDFYVLAAVPVAFFVAAAVGVVMERTVLRYLYGRPLESLLATWGLSLVLIQAARVTFGPQNLELSNPSWMSGSVELFAGLSLPWNRIVIVGFSGFVLLLIWLMMQRTRLGMFVRAVTQNRPMAGCVGVPTARVDTMAFAIGAGVAGLGGLALSQIANVGPAMGQGYIVDSFMVVVLGGVGQLAGAVSAAFGLGIFTKFLEGWTGAVVAKILVLVFIIMFIQKRPQGIFALKGRFADQ
ncbi:urea ABC transporter permease subunit UrtB [Pseudazoarcus pumilus]|uniref:Urea ABC transporter permease subunit UrtB n=1 Tax=Pseudazoarcus pumilus TaxID=2067960 RepID=A0A2I6S312_9RHOO|nr:urea ABC transporter permease subunit UrtB [Pseudazoarcus pumilus]AUN93662.1 urea ABC transporter permease subunit UrtB [Pseudazoarcus pumilus]